MAIYEGIRREEEVVVPETMVSQCQEGNKHLFNIKSEQLLNCSHEY